MSNRWRRYEVLLPLQFNDGRAVPSEWLAEAVLEIVDHFGAASYETQKVEGHRRQGLVVYRDDLARIVIDVPDLAKNRPWIKHFKKRWKDRFEQLWDRRTPCLTPWSSHRAEFRLSDFRDDRSKITDGVRGFRNRNPYGVPGIRLLCRNRSLSSIVAEGSSPPASGLRFTTSFPTSRVLRRRDHPLDSESDSRGEPNLGGALRRFPADRRRH